MAKSKSILPLSGKLGDQVHVASKYGSIVRNAPEGGGKNNSSAFNEQAERTGYLNKLAGGLNTIMDKYVQTFKQKDFYNVVQKRFRKEPYNNRYLLLKQLERMEVNEGYPLTKLGSAKVNVDSSPTKITVGVNVDFRPPASVKRHKVNCYSYEVLLLCWVKDIETALPFPQYGDWIFLKDALPEFEFEFKPPVDTEDWLVCLKQKVGFDEKAIDLFVGEGMQIVLAGSFDKKSLELLDKRKKEKEIEAEKSERVNDKTDVVRVKAKVKRPG
jgi:hypothetical protein